MTPDNAMELSADLNAGTATPPDTFRWLAAVVRRLKADVSFDTALLCVSHCLVEAEASAEQGRDIRASRLLSLAEACALRSGYLELVSLVWAYEAPPGRE